MTRGRGDRVEKQSGGEESEAEERQPEIRRRVEYTERWKEEGKAEERMARRTRGRGREERGGAEEEVGKKGDIIEEEEYEGRIRTE